MKIIAFRGNVQALELTKTTLKNRAVVIDGQNYFFNMYKESGLPFVFGCESNKYADYLREHLSTYKRANVKCYFIFKGGHENPTKQIKKGVKCRFTSLDIPTNEIVIPVFNKTIVRDVLIEMKVDHVTCQFESKRQCIALAQKLNCPIITDDIEFCFSGVPVIHSPNMKYNSQKKSFECGIFHYNSFMRKYNLNKDMLAIFIIVRDISIFPKGTFDVFFNKQNFPIKPFSRNLALLKWLPTKHTDEITRQIFEYLDGENQKQFIKEKDRILGFICRIERPGIPIQYLLNRDSLVINNHDPEWFEKGISLGYIPRIYINVYHSGAICGSWCLEDPDADDSLLFVLDIIIYAHNLLTNFQKDHVTFHDNKGEAHVIENSSTVSRPEYEAHKSPFENGWGNVRSMKLLEHFIEKTLKGINISAIDTLPEDVRLIMLALIYFSRRKLEDCSKHVYSILLSYLALAVVDYKSPHAKVICVSETPKQLVNNSLLSKDLVTSYDCEVAKCVLEEYFKLNTGEMASIFDRKLIHSFVQFQHCLSHLNNLNVLCGNPYQKTLYSGTFNATFIYKFFYSIKDMPNQVALTVINDILFPAPTVLSFFNGLVKVYEEIMNT